MARIRTIKPEFPHSESLARVSRDARLCFVSLWTICDDAGRARGNARMLASLLFPYDEDAPGLIDGWLAELERVDAIRRYEVEGKSYIAITNWLKHQRIEKPTPSRFPEPPGEGAGQGESVLPLPSNQNSPTPHRSLAEPSPTCRRSLTDASPQEGKGKKGNGPGREGNGLEGTMARSAHADAVQAYNAVASELNWPQVRHLTPMRKARLDQRLRECGGIDGWRDAMARARASPFLRGETRRGQGHENWTPDFDFLLQQGSFTRLMEGKYDERSTGQNPTGFDALLAGARAAASD